MIHTFITEHLMLHHCITFIIPGLNWILPDWNKLLIAVYPFLV